ncbi:hypothetical protein DENSPDRAFT_688914 [Dentipellis sp. KUC8613]|nr:hypothetical protein DENSPDRAFT_688914 [Dentipellis sp. KUC8613]
MQHIQLTEPRTALIYTHHEWHAQSRCLVRPVGRQLRSAEHLFWRAGIRTLGRLQHRSHLACRSTPIVLVSSLSVLHSAASIQHAPINRKARKLKSHRLRVFLYFFICIEFCESKRSQIQDENGRLEMRPASAGLLLGVLNSNVSSQSHFISIQGVGCARCEALPSGHRPSGYGGPTGERWMPNAFPR